MNKATRIAIAAAFGAASALPAFADFENTGPSDQQGRHTTALSEVNPPALDGSFPALANTRSGARIYSADADRYTSERQFRSERQYTADNREGRIHKFFHRDGRASAAPDNQVYGGVSEPGSMSEPGMRSGEFNWDHYTVSSMDYRYGSGS